MNIEDADVEVKEFKVGFYSTLVNASRSDNPLLSAIASTPEFQKALKEQAELFAMVNLRQRVSVSDELVDSTVSDIVELASNLAAIFKSSLTMSKATNQRTVRIETPSGHLSITYTPPMFGA